MLQVQPANQCQLNCASCAGQCVTESSIALTFRCACFKLPCILSGNACISPSFLKDIAPPIADIMARVDDAAPNYRLIAFVSVTVTSAFCKEQPEHTLECSV